MLKKGREKNSFKMLEPFESMPKFNFIKLHEIFN